MHPKLTWLGSLCSSLGTALGAPVTFSIHDTVDPLKKLVYLDVGESLGKKDFNPVQRIVHGFAKVNDCVVYKIYKSPKRLVLEVLTKTRNGPVMDKNPFSK